MASGVTRWRSAFCPGFANTRLNSGVAWMNLMRARFARAASGIFSRGTDRSEEHTSELQSRQYLVSRLLLEKNKKNNREEDHATHKRHCRPVSSLAVHR